MSAVVVITILPKQWTYLCLLPSWFSISVWTGENSPLLEPFPPSALSPYTDGVSLFHFCYCFLYLPILRYCLFLDTLLHYWSLIQVIVYLFPNLQMSCVLIIKLKLYQSVWYLTCLEISDIELFWKATRPFCKVKVQVLQPCSFFSVAFKCVLMTQLA